MNAGTEHTVFAAPITASADVTTALLTELHHADHIIKIMLRAMTVQQQDRVGVELEVAGVDGEGMIRHHERAAAIAAATANKSGAMSRQLLDIDAHATDIIGHADHADILLQALFDKVGGLRTREVVSSIECFATCAARAVTLMREAADNIVALVAEGGAR